MCGIVGAIAERSVSSILLTGLKRLEYRGYDSAGMATLENGQLKRLRSVGKVAMLEGLLEQEPLKGGLGIAHTRWATHGIPHERNAHPHVSGSLAIVHNGIIENYKALKDDLLNKNYQFESETDTEVVAHLIREALIDARSLLEAIQRVLPKLQGAFSLAVIDSAYPEVLVAARKGTPLVVGLGLGENFIASDPFALLPVTHNFIYLEDFDSVALTRDQVRIFDGSNTEVTRKTSELSAAEDVADKGPFKHYMQKEIFAQPKALADTLNARLTRSFDALINAPEGTGAQIKAIHFNACGTSFHAACVAKYWFEAIGIACQVEVASEYRYRDSVTQENAIFISISQSGETLDTLEALKLAKGKPFLGTLAICNSPDSAIVRASDWSLLTHAGREIGVASTKAFSTQLAVLLLLVQSLAKTRSKDLEESLVQLPFLSETILHLNDAIEQLSIKFAEVKNALFIGRGAFFPIAMEGALKLKEISYIHAESYPGGELKHGPLALVDAHMPVIAIVANDGLADKMIANLEEINARGGRLYIFKDRSVSQTIGFGEEILLPAMPKYIAPIMTSIALQLFAYHVACVKGTDVDQPRNLAKSVTVE